MLESVDLAASSLEQSGKNPRRSAAYKKAEISTRDLSRRLQDFQDQMSFVDPPPCSTRSRPACKRVHEQAAAGGVMEGKKK
ncbi:MAG: hypothetical protein WDO73_21395 [Ignavibacteriota bacterium]